MSTTIILNSNSSLPNATYASSTLSMLQLRQPNLQEPPPTFPHFHERRLALPSNGHFHLPSSVGRYPRQMTPPSTLSATWCKS
ncbi:uncharacterized protein BJ212DRAFT_1355567 [Suillus subaureus]|uniref:Uncharacterized protein n=1 Tax=Suillus subaureus TaxID=48587 RepID=A0A9P7EAX9_9AGAM|nr:uncharacterized protein BJ212DRAFT_1355567 [Suillus subaureus]KAG1815931.1 hypothetical protein BJ212DRAFT_1355567 [Suillus subaureus]